jgi:hypothetical protein
MSAASLILASNLKLTKSLVDVIVTGKAYFIGVMDNGK